LISNDSIEFTAELGAGTSGKVFKGLFHSTKDAIKVLKAVDERAIKQFKKEFQVMIALRSPYIVHFFGACLEPKICMVMEYCAHRSLYDFLNDSSATIEWPQAWSFGVQMALGLEFLHSVNVLHRDIKSLNLMLTKDWQVKLADFGLARFNTAEKLSTMTKVRGTYAFLAPEIFFGKGFTDSSDMWSAGIVLWEIARRVVVGKYEAPYHEFNIKIDFQILYQVAEKLIRPTIPKSCPSAWVDAINSCLQSKPEDRATAAQLTAALQVGYASISSSSTTTSTTTTLTDSGSVAL